MIDNFSAKTQGNTLIVKISNGMVHIGEPQEGKKPKLIDVAFGNTNAIINDLKSQGYTLKYL